MMILCFGSSVERSICIKKSISTKVINFEMSFVKVAVPNFNRIWIENNFLDLYIILKFAGLIQNKLF